MKSDIVRNPLPEREEDFFMAKIAVIGVGQVGATAAYTLLVLKGYLNI